jgi:ankyrin repeat protein
MADENDILTAAENGNADRVSELICAGADVEAVDVNQRTALILACWYGHAKCVEPLLAANANAKAADKLQITALMIACIGGHVECVKLLLPACLRCYTRKEFNAQLDRALVIGMKDSLRELLESAKRVGGDMTKRARACPK